MQIALGSGRHLQDWHDLRGRFPLDFRAHSFLSVSIRNNLITFRLCFFSFVHVCNMINLNVSIANTRLLIRIPTTTNKQKKEKNPKTFSLCNCQWIASWMHVKKRLECTSCQKVKIGKKKFPFYLVQQQGKEFPFNQLFLMPYLEHNRSQVWQCKSLCIRSMRSYFLAMSS